jgi:hypothetical protein
MLSEINVTPEEKLLSSFTAPHKFDAIEIPNKLKPIESPKKSLGNNP